MADIDFVNHPVQAAQIGTATVPARLESSVNPLCSPKTPKRLLDVINVRDFGAIGDFSHDDTTAIQAAFDVAYHTGSPTNRQPPETAKNRMVFFPPGHYKITAPLQLVEVFGSRIVGSGMNSTIIENVTVPAATTSFASARPGDCIQTNSYTFSNLEHMTLKIQPQASNSVYGSTCFKMNTGSGAFACQSNNFYSVAFDGGQTGLSLAAIDQIQCSETLLMGCVFKNQSATNAVDTLYQGQGISCGGLNACDNSIVGGSFENCFTGLYIPSGSFNLIDGVTFANGGSNNADIWVEGGARDSYAVRGCRSSSKNFIFAHGGVWYIEGNYHDPPTTAGRYVYNWAQGMVIKEGLSTRGDYLHEAGANNFAAIRGCSFGRSDWSAWPPGVAGVHGEAPLEIENLTFGTSGTPGLITRQRYSISGTTGFQQIYDYVLF